MKTITLLSFLTLLFFLSSCNDELTDYNDSSSTTSISKDELSKGHMCLDVILPEDLGKISTYGATLKNKMWQNGQIIRIKFLNGDQYIQSKVIQYLLQWQLYANVYFLLVQPNEYADIKIRFDSSGSSWSTVGTDAKSVPQNQPSMNFGWFNHSTSESEFSGTILHEFGHALGMIHEHQSPAGIFMWNVPMVYAYYAQAPNYWTPQQVDKNIFARYDATMTNFTYFDQSSIMLYSFPPGLTLNGWWSIPNNQLSATDKIFISMMYPGRSF